MTLLSGHHVLSCLGVNVTLLSGHHVLLHSYYPAERKVTFPGSSSYYIIHHNTWSARLDCMQSIACMTSNIKVLRYRFWQVACIASITKVLKYRVWQIAPMHGFYQKGTGRWGTCIASTEIQALLDGMHKIQALWWLSRIKQRTCLGYWMGAGNHVTHFQSVSIILRNKYFFVGNQ